MAWVSGAIVYGAFLCAPLLKKFDPVRTAGGFAAALLVLSFAPAVQPPNESDEADYIVAALALIHTGSLRVDSVGPALENFYFERVPATWQFYYQQPNKVKYSYRMIGYPAILAPFAFVAENITVPAARWLIVFFPGIIGYGLLMLGIARILITSSERALTMLTMGIALPFLYFATNSQPETWMAAGVAWMFYLSTRLPEKIVVFTAVAVSTILLHERMVIFSALFLLYGFFKDKKVGPLAALFFVPVLFSYASTRQFEWSADIPHAYGQNIERQWLASFNANFFSVDNGLLICFLPILCLPAARRISRVGWFGVFVFLVYFGVIIDYPAISPPHSRYMLPALPLLAPLFASAYAEMRKSRIGLSPAYLLIVAQIMINVLFLSVPSIWRCY